jgi:hypothetical protein
MDKLVGVIAESFVAQVYTWKQNPFYHDVDISVVA